MIVFFRHITSTLNIVSLLKGGTGQKIFKKKIAPILQIRVISTEFKSWIASSGQVSSAHSI